MPINTEPNLAPSDLPSLTPTSFTNPTPQVVAGEAQIFTPMSQHLTADEIKPDGTSWVKIFFITAVLLLILDAGIYGYNIWRGQPNPDLLAPITSLLNR